MYGLAYIEITDRCNAKCKWCPTGILNCEKSDQMFNYMPVQMFADVLDHLLEEKILAADGMIGLYNWGEPFLHPEFGAIMRELNQRNLSVVSSTNASILYCTDVPGLYSNMRQMIFSMPGFSQASYDNMHGFSFQKVCANIEKILSNMRDHGFTGEAVMAFHSYQFNSDEQKAAQEFCTRNRMVLNAYCAYFTTYRMMKSFFDSSLPYETIKKASQELCLFYLEGVRQKRPSQYQCPQIYDILAISPKAKLMLCCGIYYNDSESDLGAILDMGLLDIERMKKSNATCEKCASYGIDYLFHNPQKVQDTSINSAATTTCRLDTQMFWDSGDGYSEANSIRLGMDILDRSFAVCFTTEQMQNGPRPRVFRFDPATRPICIWSITATAWLKFPQSAFAGKRQ